MDRRPIYKIKHSLSSPAFFLLMPVFLFSFSEARPQMLNHFTGDSTKFISELNWVFSPLVANELKMSEALVKDFSKKWNAEI